MPGGTTHNGRRRRESPGRHIGTSRLRTDIGRSELLSFYWQLQHQFTRIAYWRRTVRQHRIMIPLQREVFAPGFAGLFAQGEVLLDTDKVRRQLSGGELGP